MISPDLSSKADKLRPSHEIERANQNWHFEAGDLDPAQLSTRARKIQAQTIASLVIRLISWLRRLIQAPSKHLQRRQAIDDLRSLDDHLLEDIGLRRTDIEMAVDGKLESRQSRPLSVPGFDNRFLLNTQRTPEPANANRAGDAAA